MKRSLRGRARINNDNSDPLGAGTLGDNTDTTINRLGGLSDISQLIVEPVNVVGLADPQLFIVNNSPATVRILQFFAPWAFRAGAAGRLGSLQSWVH